VDNAQLIARYKAALAVVEHGIYMIDERQLRKAIRKEQSK
jgi:hypothetical protein